MKTFFKGEGQHLLARLPATLRLSQPASPVAKIREQLLADEWPFTIPGHQYAHVVALDLVQRPAGQLAHPRVPRRHRGRLGRSRAGQQIGRRGHLPGHSRVRGQAALSRSLVRPTGRSSRLLPVPLPRRHHRAQQPLA